VNILFVAWRDLANPLAGGSEVLVDRLAAGLVERGHGVSLLCAGPAAPRPYAVEVNGGRYTQYLRAPLAHLRRFRRHDVVVDVVNGMPFFAPLWRRGPVVGLVNHLHTQQWEQWFPGPVAGLGRLLERRGLTWAYRHCLVVAVSASTARSLEAIGVHGDRIRIVHNGTDLPELTRPKSAEPLFLALGRLVPHKRFDLLLEAWERVRPQVGGRLVIAGSGPEAPRLAAMAGPGVELVGQVDGEEKHRLLSRAWLLLHPAMFEGWGLVVMEAAAACTPTVGFEVRGLCDSIVHGRTGLLAGSADTFVEHWLTLARGPELRATMGSEARRRAATFGWADTVDSFVPVAEEAVARHRTAVG
jgi:glycosyltransferase involved in cell wall biosynthesis